jgi:hypothetical protein
MNYERRKELEATAHEQAKATMPAYLKQSDDIIQEALNIFVYVLQKYLRIDFGEEKDCRKKDAQAWLETETKRILDGFLKEELETEERNEVAKKVAKRHTKLRLSGTHNTYKITDSIPELDNVKGTELFKNWLDNLDFNTKDERIILNELRRKYHGYQHAFTEGFGVTFDIL